MEESNVVNDSDDFVPMTPDAAAVGANAANPTAKAAPSSTSNVINDDAEEFVPMEPPRRTLPIGPNSEGVVSMPTPDQMVHPDQIKRLDSVPFEFADIRALAQRILKRAQEQGQQKLNSARQTVAAMEKEAADKAYKESFPKGQEAGYQKGLKDGMAESEKKIAAAIESEKESLRQNVAPTGDILQQIIEALNASKQQLMAQAEGDLLLLALDLAKRLVGHELSIDPEAVKPLATECIGLVTDRSNITARVNPEDFRVMQEFLPQLKTIFTDMGPLHVVPDASIERGGIIAATREAEVDMRLATRLAAFEEVILGYSGEDAVAPWSAIPADAIASAKATNAESPYSLPPLDSESEMQQEHTGHEESTPILDTAQQAQEEAADQELVELASMMDDADQPQAIPSPGGDDAAADPDLADLAELADLTDQLEAGGDGQPAQQ